LAMAQPDKLTVVFTYIVVMLMLLSIITPQDFLDVLEIPFLAVFFFLAIWAMLKKVKKKG
jgi:di/tricarboxylate transporter